jgi:Ni/Co efflux regulator RcnB
MAAPLHQESTMNRLKSLSGLLVAAAFVLPVAALAQDRHDDHHDNQPSQEHHDDRRDAPAAHDERARGAGPDHNWHKGDRVPATYRNKRYEVTDWKARHLRQPPRGYHWVNVNGDFVLAAIATGVIADLFLTQ